MESRWVRELLLHELQRRSGTENARELGKAREGISQRGRAGRGERVDRLCERTPGRDGGDDVAQTVGPCDLHFAHPQPATTREVTPGKQRHRDRRHQRDEERPRQRDEDQECEQAGGGAACPEPSRRQTGSGLVKPEAIARAAGREHLRRESQVRKRSHERARN
jgi:hypothetical protein